MKLFFVFFVNFICWSAHAAIVEGGEGGNGGQEVALEFAVFGTDIVNLIERNFYPGAPSCSVTQYSDLCELDLMRVRDVVRFARVLSVPELTRVDPNSGAAITYNAMNFPQEQRILVSEAGWRSERLCYAKKVPLVFHEYLGLLGLEVENYRYSAVLSAWFRKNSPKEKFIGCPDLEN